MLFNNILQRDLKTNEILFDNRGNSVLMSKQGQGYGLSSTNKNVFRRLCLDFRL